MMLKHVLILVWHRKAAYLPVILELLFTFLILFSLAGTSLYFFRLYTVPLGFEVEDTWTVSVETGGRWHAGDEAVLLQLMAVLGQMDEIRSVHTMQSPPFTQAGSSSSFTVDGRPVTMSHNRASDGLMAALGMELLEGRWYGIQDDGLEAPPVVINRRFREDVFGDESPVGKRHELNGEILRIVGVFEDFRQYGEFAPLQNYLFRRQNDGYFEAPALVLVLRGGVTLQFEEKLVNTMQGVAQGWSFDIRPWPLLQQNHFATYTYPLAMASVLALFLIGMVGLGLLGVLWQNVTRRSPEIGLRRAMGATAGAVRRQVVLELLAVAALALCLGLVLVLQFPLSGLIRAMDWSLFIPSVIMAALILLGLCVLFALYPSFQATRKEPVEALRYE